jgi:ribonuclease P protein component
MNIERLKKRYQYLRVAKSSVRVKTKNFILQATKSFDSEACFRFGITASKRVGSAVHRNFAKRRIRAMIQNFSGSLLASPPSSIDFVIIAFPTLGMASFDELSKDFCGALADCIQRIK